MRSTTPCVRRAVSCNRESFSCREVVDHNVIWATSTMRAQDVAAHGQDDIVVHVKD
jgi:hypothetical protein